MDKTNWIRIRRVKNRFINVPLEGFSRGEPRRSFTTGRNVSNSTSRNSSG